MDGYKNMVGTFNQPDFVVCDTTLLSTLPLREFRTGLAEALKAGIIADAGLFETLERTSVEELRRDRALLERIVGAAIRVKRDEREGGERRKLNLGHTFGHALEKCSSKMNHGEAVAVGTVIAARGAVKLGLLEDAERERIEGALARLGFETESPVELRKLLKAVARDKKAEGELVRMVFPERIGACTVRPTALAELAELLK